MKPLTQETAAILSPINFHPQDNCVLQINNEGNRFIADFFRYRPFLEDGVKVQKRSWPSHAVHALMERFPEREQLDCPGNYQKWAVSCTDTSVAVFDKVFPSANLRFADDETRLTYNVTLAATRQLELNAEIVARYKENKTVPQHGLQLHPQYPISPYQQVATYLSTLNDGFGLFMEQGTGKTPCVIARICNEAPRIKREKQRMYRVIIVCPNNVRLNWYEELCKFTTVKGQAEVLRGNAIQRVEQLTLAFTDETGESEFTAVIVGYDTLSKSWDSLGRIDWDLAVLDESHYIKSTSTIRFKYAMRLRDNSTSRMVLTGTPITNTIVDLYAQFEFMGRGYSGFNSWKNFKSFYGVYKADGAGFQRLVGLQNIPFIKERLARLSYIITKKEALPDLPEKVYDVIEVEMSKPQADAYQALCSHLAVEIEAELESDLPRQLVVTNVLTKLLRLAQITSGYIKWDEQNDDEGNTLVPARIEPFNPNAKLDVLMELLRDKGENDKTIIWACWTQDIKAIVQRLKDEDIKAVSFYGGTSEADRDKAKHDFNHDRETKVFVGNPAAGGTGLNLLGYPPTQGDEYETNCNHIIYYSQNWSPTARSQSEDRANRRGTRENTRITDLCVPGTIDEEIRAAVLQKRITAYEISDLTQILKNVLRGVAINV